MESLNWVDILILAIFLFSTISGLLRGFVREVISLIALVAAVFLATQFSDGLALSYTHSSAVQGVAGKASETVTQTASYAAIGLSYIVIFVGALIVGAIVGFIVNLFLSASMLGFGNRMLGGVFGLCRGFILTLVLIFVFQLTAISAQEWWQKSVLIKEYQPAVLWLAEIVSPTLADFKKKVNEAYEKAKSDMEKAAKQMKPQEVGKAAETEVIEAPIQ